jgi:hypothetical protein
MGDFLNCIDATPFQRLNPPFTVARVRDGAVAVAVVSSLIINTVIAVAALVGPLSRSFAGVEIRTNFSNSVNQGVSAGNGDTWLDVVTVDTGRGR